MENNLDNIGNTIHPVIKKDRIITPLPSFEIDARLTVKLDVYLALALADLIFSDRTDNKALQAFGHQLLHVGEKFLGLDSKPKDRAD